LRLCAGGTLSVTLRCVTERVVPAPRVIVIRTLGERLCPSSRSACMENLRTTEFERFAVRFEMDSAE
jgi:hypothetical protein